MNNIPNRLVNSLSFRVNNFLQKPLAKRADNPYATHVPILVTLGQLLPVRYILELGCGQYSTLTFLDTCIFPKLISLQSVENDQAWAEKITSLVKDDPRFKLSYIQGDIYVAIDEALVNQKDIIFIDDSVNAVERAATIRAVCKYTNASTVLVIHDYETKLYRDSVQGFSNSFRFTAFNPNIGILWNDASISPIKLRNLNNFFKKNQKFDLENHSQWLTEIKRLI